MAEQAGSYLGENTVLFTRYLALLHGLPHPVVAALHKPALQLDGVPQKPVVLDAVGAVDALARAEALELAVELGVAALGQQEQQVQTSDLVAHLGVGLELRRGQLIEGLQLREVAGEGVWVAGANRGEGAILVDAPGEQQELGGRVGGGCEGVQLQQRQLGFGEQTAGFAVGQRRIGL